MRTISIILVLAFLVCFNSASYSSTDIFLLEKNLAGMPADTTRAKTLVQLGEYYCSRDFEKALLYLQEALVLSTRLNYQKGIAGSFLWQGRAYYYKDDYLLASSYLEKAREIYEETNDSNGLANYHFISGAINNLIGNHINAIQDFQEVISLSILSGDLYMKSLGLQSLGRLYLDRKDPEKALQYLKEALLLKEEISDEPGIAGNLMLLGLVFDQLNLPDSALFYMELGYEKGIAQNELRGIASLQLTFANFLIRLGNPKKAYDLLLDSHKNFSLLKEETGVCMAIIGQAKALSVMGEFQQAYHLATAALELAQKLGNPLLISECYNSKALIFAADQQFDKAFEFKLLHEALADSLAEENKERIIRELDIKFQTTRKTDEIKLLQSQNEVQKKSLQLLYVSVSGLLIFLILVLFLFRLRSADYKRKQKIFENEKIIREQENELREKEQLLLKEQLEAKNRELASKALEMLRVNETIVDVIEKLESFGNGDSKNNDALSQQINSLISGLETQLKGNSWNEFEKIFNNIHSDFFQKILSVCPDLTPSEIKIAALLKLNLNSKEMAAITFKSEAGIKSIRYRLRRKLGLCSDDNLIPYLMKL